MIQFGPYISEKEQQKIIPIVNKQEGFVPSGCNENYFINEQFKVWKKVFHPNLIANYEKERDCLLELQSAECVPILIGYNDDKKELYIDVVHGPNLLTYCKDENISLNSFKEEIHSGLSSMLEKGWFYQRLDVYYMIWCEDCQAFFIIDYESCIKVDSHQKKYYESKLEDVVSAFLQKTVE